MLYGTIDYVDHLETISGSMPTPPDILLEFMGGARIPIEYMGPLAQKQKQLFQTRGIMESLQISAPFIEKFPETADLINKDQTLKDLLIAFGFPQANFVPTDIVGQIREGRALAQQEEKRKIDMGQLAEVLKDLGLADKHSQGKFTQQIGEILGGGQPGALPVAA